MTRLTFALGLAACSTSVKAPTQKAVAPAATVVAAPSTPAGLSATVADASVTLTWAAADNAASYAITRARDGVTFTALATTHAPTYVDTAVVNGHAYSYEVQASGAGGNSAFSPPLSATPLSAYDHWTVRQHSASLSGIAYGAKTFVAVGNGGMVRDSTDDGATWSTAVSTVTADITRVTYEPTRGFVAVSTDAVITSPDGITWTAHAPVHTDQIAQVAANGLACNPARCVATAVGIAFTSTDLASWTQSTLPLHAADIAANDAGFVVGGTTGTTSAIAFAANGVTWSPVYSDASFGVTRVLSGPSGFAAFTNTSTGFALLASGDGSQWASTSSSTCAGGSVISAAQSTKQIFAVCDSRGAAVASTDAAGGGWAATQSLPVAAFFSSVSFGATHFVAVGEAGTIVTVSGTTATTVVSEANLASVAYGANVYVAVGSDAVIDTSSDMHTWTRHTAPMRDPLERVTFGATKFWTVGDEKIFSSGDGSNWRPESTPLIFGRLHGVAVATDGTVIAVGDYDASSATFAVLSAGTWTAYTGPTLPALADIAWGAGQFVAVGANGSILTSALGATAEGWQAQTSGVASDLVRVIWNGTAFLALSRAGDVLSASDGAHWSTIAVGPSTTFTALGSDGTTTLVGGANAFLASSAASSPWAPRYPVTPSTSDTFTDFLFANGTWLAIGADALIMTKP